MKTQFLKRYIRNEENQPRGVAVVVKDENGHLKFGYSLCNPKDQFSKKLGTSIALARATHPTLGENEYFVPNLPDKQELIKDFYLDLEDKANRRFTQTA